MLCRMLSAEVFDADETARRLVEKDSQVQQRIREQFGDEVFAQTGDIDRAKLRAIVFANETRRRELEAILHPVIRETWLPQAEKFRREKKWLLVDIPLLFETDAGQYFDTLVVIACSHDTQLRRLCTLRNLDEQMAGKIIAAQMPLHVKISRADHVIWNDGAMTALERQTTLFSEYLTKRY